MSWARIDDGFDDHPKVLALLEEEQGVAAVGLWTLCLTWASRRRRDTRSGTVPFHLPDELVPGASEELTRLLEMFGLWRRTVDGWAFLGEDDVFQWGAIDERRPWIPLWLRRRIRDRDRNRCVECGADDDLTLDHIHPWSLGGPDTEDNLRVLCRSCNSKKGARV